MAKYLVETYYTCSFKVKHYLNDLNDSELSNLEKRDDGKFEILDVKLDNRKTKNLDPKNQKINSTETVVDTPKVKNVSNDITELIEQDVYITSSPPKYYYTNLGELKIEMIKHAAEDGLLRAQTSVQGGGGKLGELLETSIGVFQILGENSNE